MAEYTQDAGWIIRVLIGGVSLILVASAFVVPLVLIALPLFLWLGWMSSRLTVRLHGGTVSWSFRGGFWRKELKYSEILGAEVVRLRWWRGQGVNWTPEGWLYNVGVGGAAVKVTTRGGRSVILGADQAAALAAEIRTRMTGRV